MGKDKLKRFAENEKMDNVIQPELKEVLNLDHHLKGKWHSEGFHNTHPIVLELACGKGEYTIGQARMYPDKNFIGIDIKGARLWRGAKTAIEETLDNVRFLRTRIDFITSFFAKEEVAEIWITFPDPQPEGSRERKRLTGPLFLNRYKEILSKDGTINLKTDSDFFYTFTKEMIEENDLKLLEDIEDVYGKGQNQMSDELKRKMDIKTFYEKKWLEEGKKIKYLKFKFD